jgi:hypothetical protein
MFYKNRIIGPDRLRVVSLEEPVDDAVCGLTLPDTSSFEQRF